MWCKCSAVRRGEKRKRKKKKNKEKNLRIENGKNGRGAENGEVSVCGDPGLHCSAIGHCNPTATRICLQMGLIGGAIGAQHVSSSWRAGAQFSAK